MKDENWVMKRKRERHGPSRLKKLLESYGSPQDSLQVIHIAGTNGKGSTCQYLSDILVSQGFKVGLFTSPHMSEHRDRIRINGAWIPHERFMKYVSMCEKDIEAYDLGMFEIDVLIAFLYFRDEQVDYAVLEAGMGGRNDSTNVMERPVLSLITTVGYDHMQYLGERLEQIAYEKAGIMTPDSDGVIGYLDEACEQVIEKYAKNVHARLLKLPENEVIENQDFTTSFRFMGDVYTVGSGALYQADNASMALFCAWVLGIDVHSEAVKKAVLSSFWPGRFEVVSKDPLVVLDGAHNEEGMRALVEAAASLPRPLVSVFSALKDKPGRKMASMLRGISDRMYVTSFESERADSVDALMIEDCIKEPDEETALKRAMEDVKDGGCVLVSGSLYFISSIRPMFVKK